MLGGGCTAILKTTDVAATLDWYRGSGSKSETSFLMTVSPRTLRGYPESRRGPELWRLSTDLQSTRATAVGSGPDDVVYANGVVCSRTTLTRPSADVAEVRIAPSRPQGGFIIASPSPSFRVLAAPRRLVPASGRAGLASGNT